MVTMLLILICVAAGNGDPYVDPTPPPPPEQTTQPMDTTSSTEMSDEKVQVGYFYILYSLKILKLKIFVEL